MVCSSHYSWGRMALAERTLGSTSGEGGSSLTALAWAYWLSMALVNSGERCSVRALVHLFLEQFLRAVGRVDSRAGDVATSGIPQELHPRGSESSSATSGNSAGKGLGTNNGQSVLHILSRNVGSSSSPGCPAGQSLRM